MSACTSQLDSLYMSHRLSKYNLKAIITFCFILTYPYGLHLDIFQKQGHKDAGVRQYLRQLTYPLMKAKGLHAL